MKKGIAFFDFDGTITTKDTLLEFIRFYKGNAAFLTGFLVNAPYLVAFKAGMISNQKAKEKVLQFFFKNTPESQFKNACDAFAQNIIPRLLRPKALEEIEKLKASGNIIVIVSASPQNWLCNWAESIGAELIASQLEVQDGMITGRLVGNNCHGQEKVRRIMEKYVMDDFDEIYAYGDSKGDRPMLALAKNSFYKPFR